jgi:hypothetical protein
MARQVGWAMHGCRKDCPGSEWSAPEERSWLTRSQLAMERCSREGFSSWKEFVSSVSGSIWKHISFALQRK